MLSLSRGVRVGAYAALLIVAAGCNPSPSRAGSGAGERGAQNQRSRKVRGDNMAIQYSKSGYDVTALDRDRVEALASKLSPEAYKITQKSDTEPAFCGTLLD
ncbi:MAG: hypothetical protein IIB60_06560, partial [Planctomycetes bacterium]|nr:hypothetical protein [Planctomycetota bacterium]